MAPRVVLAQLLLYVATARSVPSSIHARDIESVGEEEDSDSDQIVLT